MKLFFFVGLILSLSVLGGNVSAQEDVTQAAVCPLLVRTTISNTSVECSTSEPGQLCLGNPAVSVEGNEALTFARTGERIPLGMVEALSSEEMGTAAGEWGMTLGRLPLIVTPDIITQVVFGAVELQNLGVSTPMFPMTVSSRTGAFVRSQPDATSRDVAALIVGQDVVATGRIPDSSWLRVELSESAVGWVRADVVSLVNEFDAIERLAIVTPQATPERVYRPMYAFHFRSGIGDAPCNDAPESGILLQTPENIADTDTPPFLINGIQVRLDGTAFLQARSEAELILNLIEGEATITLDEDAQRLQAGERFVFDAGRLIRDQYDYRRMEMLPLELLGRDIVIATDWQQVLIPAQANPLQGIGSDDECTIAPANNINVRVGPGEGYASRGSMLANQSANPDGRTLGLDGAVWWRLAQGAWVSFDVIFNAGDCSELPFIETLPRLERSFTAP